MFPRSLQWRMVSFFCLVVFCLIIAIGLYLNSRIESKYYQNFIDRLEKGFDTWIASNDSLDAESLKEKLINNPSALLGNPEHKTYTITDKQARIYYTNDELLSNPETSLNSLLASDNFVQAMTGSEDNRKILESYGGKSFFDYARFVGDHILYFRYYKDDWAEITGYFNNIIYTSLALSLVIAFAAVYFLSGAITSPLVRLMRKAENIAAGDFGQTLEVKSNDEIGKLTHAFNYMANSLKNTLTEISSEKSKMEAILNYMTDGVIAFNIRGEVIHTNPASSRILGVEGDIGNFGEFCDRFGFDYSLENVQYLQSKQPTEMSVQTGEKVVKAYFAVFTDEEKKPGGVITVLQDITEQQRLENMRKEFVANVSHELRTPLTSIKSYCETLLDGMIEDRETAEKFLGVINSEADRMTRLVKDLLLLSRLDNQQTQWNFERVSLVDLVRSVVERSEMEAASRKQKLECFVMGDIPEIEADYGRMEQVIFNLVGNAIKYTPEGGEVTVYVGRIYNDAYIKVTDNGIGIPEDDLSRIFERFYRVDKARSRKMGGTGLGLSIAKEIIEAHNGSITINSQLDSGTEVTVRLPVSREAGKKQGL
jgi:two-component system sensor histidine kinase VicK